MTLGCTPFAHAVCGEVYVEQGGSAQALAADALAALEVEVGRLEHCGGYLLQLEAADAMAELAQVGAQAGEQRLGLGETA